MDPLNSVLNALFASKYGTLAIYLFLGWTVLSWICTQIKARSRPPSLGSKWTVPYQIMSWIAGSYGFASSAYEIGVHSVKIPLNMSRTEASVLLGLDPSTTSPRQRGLPQPVQAADEKNTAQTQDTVKAEQTVIATVGLSDKAPEKEAGTQNPKG